MRHSLHAYFDLLRSLMMEYQFCCSHVEAQVDDVVLPLYGNEPNHYDPSSVSDTKPESQYSTNSDEPENLCLGANCLLRVSVQSQAEILAVDRLMFFSCDQVCQGPWMSPRHLLRFDHVEIP